LSGRVRLPPADIFLFFFDEFSSSPPAEDASPPEEAADVAEGGEADPGDLPIPSARRAATASPSAVGRSGFSGAGVETDALAAGAAPVFVLLAFSLPVFDFCCLLLGTVVVFVLAFEP